MEEQSSPQLTPETPLEPTDSAETNISHPAESRQEENSVVSPEESVGAAPAGFNSVCGDMVGSQDKTVTTDPYLTDEEIEQYNPQHERVGWEDNKTAAYAAGEVHDSSGATAATPTRTRRDGGNATVFLLYHKRDKAVKRKIPEVMRLPKEHTSAESGSSTATILAFPYPAASSSISILTSLQVHLFVCLK